MKTLQRQLFLCSLLFYQTAELFSLYIDLGNGIDANNLVYNNATHEIIDHIFENWDCLSEEKYKHKNLNKTLDMLKDGDKNINETGNLTENTVLILGNAGVGKTTFTQFMATDNKNLFSKEIDNNLDEYFIDSTKIGTSVTDSFTLYPEQCLAGSNESYTDTPGFSDTRSPKHEVVATYVMKKYLKKIKNVKIVLLMPYDSVKYSGSKTDFIDLLKNVNSFIRNIEKFKDSIALIVTKVPNSYIKNSDTLISNNAIINSIGNYIKKVETSLSEKLVLDTIDKTEKNTIKNTMTILSSLQKIDQDGKFVRINIFRRPLKSGSLDTMNDLQQSKLLILKTLQTINYTDTSGINIGYALSYKAKNYLNCLLWYVNDRVTNISKNIFIFMKNHYENEITTYKSYDDIIDYFTILNDKISKLKWNLQNSNEYSNFSTILSNFVKNENISNDSISSKSSIQVQDYITSLQEFAYSKAILSTLEWTEEIHVLSNYVADTSAWYKLLKSLFSDLSNYKIQNSKNEITNSTFSNLTDLEILKRLLSFELKSFSDLFLYTSSQQIEIVKLNEISDVISITLKNYTDISCSDEGILVISDYFIRINQINDEVINQYCKDVPLKGIGIFALDTVFIDKDLIGERLNGIDIVIFAPKWNIVGKRLINIEGQIGKQHNDSARNSSHYSNNGEHGLSGYHGEKGGNFIGVGLSFVNEDNLSIKVNGGKGGNGQNGGNGMSGSDGKSGYDKLRLLENSDWLNYNLSYSKGSKSLTDALDLKNDKKFSDASNSMSVNKCNATLKLYDYYGECGKAGSSGGKGGTGGSGGFSGIIDIITYQSKSPNFHLTNASGEFGENGQNGSNGSLGKMGKSISCFNTELEASNVDHYNYYSSTKKENFWNCFEYKTNINCSEVTKDITGVHNNVILLPVSKPIHSKSNDFSKYIYSYVLSLKNIEENKLLSKNIQLMKKLIYQNISKKSNEHFSILLLPEY